MRLDRTDHPRYRARNCRSPLPRPRVLEPRTERARGASEGPLARRSPSLNADVDCGRTATRDTPTGGAARARPGGRAWRSGRRRRRPGPRSGASPRPRPAGCWPGAKATNQAVVFFGVLGDVGGRDQLGRAGLAGDRDARDRRRACRCRAWTTAIIMSRTWPATLALTTRLRGLRPPASHGLMRTPRLAIVAPTEAMPSGVARSLFWPIALAPTASASLRSAAFGIVLIFAAGMSGVSLKPKLLGGRRRAAWRRPWRRSGRRRELQECANEFAEAAAALLVAGVAQLDARQRRVLAHGIGARRLRDARPAAPRRR